MNYQEALYNKTLHHYRQPMISGGALVWQTAVLNGLVVLHTLSSDQVVSLPALWHYVAQELTVYAVPFTFGDVKEDLLKPTRMGMKAAVSVYVSYLVREGYLDEQNVRRDEMSDMRVALTPLFFTQVDVQENS